MIMGAVPLPEGAQVETSIDVFAALRWQRQCVRELTPVQKASAFWRLTPAALVEVCMTSNGLGGKIGDDIFSDHDNPTIWGLPIEIIMTAPAAACSISLVHMGRRHELQFTFERSAGPILDAKESEKFELPIHCTR